MKIPVLAGIVIALSFPCHANAQSKAALVGTWRLVSAKDTTDKGEVIDGYGRNPTGFITYTSDDGMMVILVKGGRQPLSTLDWMSAPIEERADAYATFAAYAGSYTFSGDRVIHHIQAASMQNLVNTDFVRFILNFDGKRMTLRTTPFVKGGRNIAYEDLVWERVERLSMGGR
jgi:hypothetical protein